MDVYNGSPRSGRETLMNETCDCGSLFLAFIHCYSCYTCYLFATTTSNMTSMLISNTSEVNILDAYRLDKNPRLPENPLLRAHIMYRNLFP